MINTTGAGITRIHRIMIGFTIQFLHGIKTNGKKKSGLLTVKA